MSQQYNNSDKKKFLYTHRSQLLTYFLSLFYISIGLISLIFLFGIPSTPLEGMIKETIKDNFTHLNFIADLKKERLQLWLEERRDDVRLITQSPLFLHELHEFLPKKKEFAPEKVQPHSSSDHKSSALLNHHLRQVINTYNAYNEIEIFDNFTGQTIASTAHDLSINKKQNTPKRWSNFPPGAEEIVYLQKENNTIYLYIQRMFHEKLNTELQHGRVVMTVKISTDDFIRPMLHSGEGLGKTGEALLVNQSRLTITSLKHPLSDGSKAIPLNTKIDADPARYAAQGQEGFTLAKDYRGAQVLAAYRHIQITSEEAWGMVVKIDQNEVFSSLKKNVAILLSLITAACLFITLIVIYISNKLSQSVSEMVKIAGEIEAGNLDARVIETKSDEMGNLSVSFNKMTRKLQQWNEELEDQVQQRTAELHTATQQLKLNQVLLNKSQEVAKLGSWHLDIRKNKLTWSEEQYRIFGRTPQNFDATYEAFLDTIHPDDQDMVKRTFQNAILNKIPYQCTHRILKDNGEVRIILEKSEDIAGEDGQIIHSYGFSQDITEQFLANQRYENVIKTSIDGFWTVNKEGRFIDVNNAYCSMTKYSRQELLQMSITDLEAKESQKQVKSHIKTVIEKGYDRFESKHRGKDGSLIDVEISANYSSHASDLIFVFIRDITEKKRIENEKKSLIARLAQAQKMEAVGTLAGGIAHDFNNILGVILGYSDLAKEDAPPNSTFADDLDKVIQAGWRARDLVKQILAFSRQTDIELIPIQIQSLIKESLKMLRATIPTTIEIRDNLDPKCGVIMADPTQVHQILMNLCTNATLAMETSGGVLDIRLQDANLEQERFKNLHIKPGKYLQLSISDTGSGIHSNIINKIFDPYFTTRETGKGTGMGLAIVHGIINDYGGTITVDSELGKGTSFNIFLPNAKQEIIETTEEIKQVPKGTERILFIDDEELLAEMGNNMLQRLGYTVTVKRNSLEALENFQNNPHNYDVVITDQTMPGMTGSDLARRMLQIRPDIPIILCTGYSNLIDEKKAKSLGIKEFALKPINLHTIATLLRKVLDQ